jgi:hypothetical protein
MNKLLKKIVEAVTFQSTLQSDYLTDGWYATDYTNHDTRQKIAAAYKQKFQIPKEDPTTHPWKYDPLNPPGGWKYDPYYELWIDTTK